MTTSIEDVLASAIVAVGDGRGFVVEGWFGRYVITAANRLHFSPTYHQYPPVDEGKEVILSERLRMTLAEAIGATIPTQSPVSPYKWREKPWPRLLGNLGEEPSASAECLFLDPINDLAVLGSPIGSDEIAYQALTASVSALPVTDMAKWSKLRNEEIGEYEMPVWLLSLSKSLITCHARYIDYELVEAGGGSPNFRLWGG